MIAILLVGLFAGFLNVIVGSGSSITVPFLTFVGLPAHIAVGTNRFAMMFNNGSGAVLYHRKKVLNLRLAVILSIFAAVGSVIGAVLSLQVSEALLNKFIGTVLIGEAIVILLSWRKFGIQNYFQKVTGNHYILGVILSFSIGLYGGFLGLAITSITMFIVIVLFGVRFIESVAITKVVTFAISFFATLIFLANLKVDLVVGAIVTVAYLGGAFLGVHSAFKMGDARIKILFLIVALASAVKLLFF